MANMSYCRFENTYHDLIDCFDNIWNEADCDCLLEAEYQGRTVPLGKPMRGDSKKFKVYVKNPKTGKFFYEEPDSETKNLDLDGDGIVEEEELQQVLICQYYYLNL